MIGHSSQRAEPDEQDRDDDAVEQHSRIAVLADVEERIGIEAHDRPPDQCDTEERRSRWSASSRQVTPTMMLDSTVKKQTTSNNRE